MQHSFKELAQLAIVLAKHLGFEVLLELIFAEVAVSVVQ
jgi:hypothetical protein